MKTIWSIGRPKDRSAVGEILKLKLEGQEVPVTIRRNAQARRMILRVCGRTGAVKLTLPNHVRLSAAEKFIDRHSDWLAAERAKLAPAQTTGDGAVIPYRGQMHQIVFTGTGTRRVTVADGVITVGGPADMASTRLLNWLKADAKKRLGERSAVHAETLDADYNRISIGDMSSRWGSCSSKGTLRFNWRLVMAPDAVLDYVAAHEVAHLLEMNHSPRFWAHVERCVPAYKADRRWLKSAAGQALMAVAFG